jgi:RHS repeat-associated protein
MGVTSYYSFGGEILGEETGGVRRDYLTDALGSVIATVTGAGVVENTYRYKPYGEQLAKTGTGSDPKFLWNGKSGYRHTGQNYTEKYVRTRHYGYKNGSWTSIDDLWPEEPAYCYVLNNPSIFIDPSGMSKEYCEKIIQWKVGVCNPSRAKGCESPEFWREYHKCVSSACKCAIVQKYMGNLALCMAARRMVTIECFGGLQDQHDIEENNMITGMEKCARKFTGCGDTSLLPPIPVRVPAGNKVPFPIIGPRPGAPLPLPIIQTPPVSQPCPQPSHGWQIPPPDFGKMGQVAGCILVYVAALGVWVCIFKGRGPMPQYGR